ncbi:MAG: hypothetical protein Q9178_005537 [Gyalolechia marmorata]
MQGDDKASHQAKRKQQRDMGSARYVADRQIHTADGAAIRPYPVSPRGPRLSPQAVHVEARTDNSEGDNVSIFSSLRSSPASSLTSVQSHTPPKQTQRPKPKKPKPGALQISAPQPPQSLLDLAANYADVQNPKKVNGTEEKPTPVAKTKPVHQQDEQKPKVFRPDQPIKEVSKGRAQVVQLAAHQRSQKTVVRKMEPQQTPRADNHVRQVYRETRFEDFMGKDSPPAPPLPANVTGLAANTFADSRLSRPFATAEASEEPTDDARPGTASTAALSRSDSRAETWLRYDRKHGESAQEQSTDAPLFPRRNMTVPDRDQHFKYTPCQTCRRQVHPSTAFSYNGTYLCEDCAATGPWEDRQKGHTKPRKEISRKAVPTSTAAATLSTSSTLRGTLSPKFSPHQPRFRRTDVPPGNEYGYLQYPAVSPIPSTTPSPTFTSSPQSPYFATPDAQGKYPRYRTPPPPPMKITSTAPNQLPSPPPTSPLRKPQPASSIYPSTPWRLSRPPSMPALPDSYNLQTKEKVKGRDTIYRAEVEQDIIDAYAADSPVSPLSENGEGDYVNAGWRVRKNMF